MPLWKTRDLFLPLPQSVFSDDCLRTVTQLVEWTAMAAQIVLRCGRREDSTIGSDVKGNLPTLRQRERRCESHQRFHFSSDFYRFNRNVAKGFVCLSTAQESATAAQVN